MLILHTCWWNVVFAMFIYLSWSYSSVMCVLCCHSYVPQTSLSRPPWPELPAFDPADEERRHQGKWCRAQLGDRFALKWCPWHLGPVLWSWVCFRLACTNPGFWVPWKRIVTHPPRLTCSEMESSNWNWTNQMRATKESHAPQSLQIKAHYAVQYYYSITHKLLV